MGCQMVYVGCLALSPPVFLFRSLILGCQAVGELLRARFGFSNFQTSRQLLIKEAEMVCKMMGRRFDLAADDTDKNSGMIIIMIRKLSDESSISWRTASLHTNPIFLCALEFSAGLLWE